jgi:hypothetical protein
MFEDPHVDYALLSRAGAQSKNIKVCQSNGRFLLVVLGGAVFLLGPWRAPP